MPTTIEAVDQLFRGGVGADPSNDLIGVVDGKHDATDAQRVRRGVVRLSTVSRQPPELRQLNTAIAVRGSHHDSLFDVLDLVSLLIASESEQPA